MPTKPPAYDRFAARYDRVTRPLERWGLGRLRARLVAGLPESGRVLEVGAGTGANFAFYPPGARWAAIEPSAEMLRRALLKTERPAGVRLARARAESLPFADASFDAAFATLVFCSVESPAAAFAELRRVVRPGGVVALLEHVRPRGALGRACDALSLLTVPLIEDHFNRRTAEEARRAGLLVERIESHLFGVVQLIFCRR